MELPSTVPVATGQLSVMIQVGSEVMTISADPRWLAAQEVGRVLGVRITDDNPIWNTFVASH
ncbi:hypothetical protein [Desulfopila aestuarii]|uniref:hypothetical protein n=1 Tax=Desulfopila aestuarii TaxID=231440 RepID=UPI0009358129|nr:hypothetical protein [Desulfopila aestuarii]